MKHYWLVISLIFVCFFVSAFKTQAATCPTDDGAGTGCSDPAKPYYCNGSCRALSSGSIPTLEFCNEDREDRPVCFSGSDCAYASSYPCGVPQSCTSGYTLCNIAGTGNASWPDAKCKANVSAPAGCSSYNQCTSVCSACSAGYELLAGQCIGATVRLGQDSVTSTYLKNSTNPLLTILSSGNVGIGITAPEASLDVAGTNGFIRACSTQLSALGGAGEAVVMTDDSGNLYSSALGSGGGGTTLPDGISGQTLRNTGTGWATSSLLFNSGTRIGIGTTNPLANLDVVTSMFMIGSNHDDNNIRDYLHFKSTKMVMPHYDMSQNPVALFMAISYSSYNKILYGGGSSDTNWATDLLFYTSPDPIDISQGGLRMIINGDGKVGIGTSAPSASLDVAGVNGFINTNNTQLVALGGSGNSIVMSDDSGNLFSTSTSSFISTNNIGFSVYVGSTGTAVNGNNNNVPGYTEAYNQCETAYSGSHVCTPDDMLNNVRLGTIFPDSNVWIFAGPPGYTASANDCNGREGSSSSDLGAYWEALSGTFPKGRGLLMACNQSLKIACCK